MLEHWKWDVICDEWPNTSQSGRIEPPRTRVYFVSGGDEAQYGGFKKQAQTLITLRINSVSIRVTANRYNAIKTSEAALRIRRQRSSFWSLYFSLSVRFILRRLSWIIFKNTLLSFSLSESLLQHFLIYPFTCLNTYTLAESSMQSVIG